MISLISHASKILTKIIQKRIENKIDAQLTEDQFGFRRKSGTREAILALRLIIEKFIKKNKKVYIAFIDIEKAFDNVRWKKMFEILEKISLTYRDRRIIYNIYKEQRAMIRIENTQEEAEIKKGVRQGCTLSPLLFNIYIQTAIDEVRERTQTGITIQGSIVDMIRYADDIALLSGHEEDLQTKLNIMDNILQDKYGMKINIKKTKIMICGKSNIENIRIQLHGQSLQQIEQFTYLGSKITSDGRNKQEIISRIQQAKMAFYKKKNLLTSTNVSLATRKRFLKTYIWSIALYGSETWTIGNQEKKRLEAFEMWCLRRILKVAWIDHVTNDEILNRAQETPNIWKTITNRRDNLMGHILRHQSLLLTIIEGMVEAKNARGRPRLSYVKQIMLDMKCNNYVEMKRLAQERKSWRIAANQSQD